jgi:hypothetical protein
VPLPFGFQLSVAQWAAEDAVRRKAAARSARIVRAGKKWNREERRPEPSSGFSSGEFEARANAGLQAG